jgi:hypothetical protein
VREEEKPWMWSASIGNDDVTDLRSPILWFPVIWCAAVVLYVGARCALCSESGELGDANGGQKIYVKMIARRTAGHSLG